MNYISARNKLFSRLNREGVTKENILGLMKELGALKELAITKFGGAEETKEMYDLFNEKIKESIANNEESYNKAREKVKEVEASAYDGDITPIENDYINSLAFRYQNMLNQSKSNPHYRTKVLNEMLSNRNGCQALLRIPNNSEYATSYQIEKAIEGSKSDREKAFNRSKSLLLEDAKSQCSKLYSDGYILRTVKGTFEKDYNKTFSPATESTES